jgi:hypothetical protein
MDHVTAWAVVFAAAVAVVVVIVAAISDRVRKR